MATRTRQELRRTKQEFRDMTATEQSAYGYGWAGGREGVSTASCPYPMTTPLFRVWMAGLIDSKASPERGKTSRVAIDRLGLRSTEAMVKAV